MKNVLQIELNKAIKTRYFAISIIIGTIIGIVGLVYNVNLVYNSQIYDLSLIHISEPTRH